MSAPWPDMLPRFRRVFALRRQEQTFDEVAAVIPLDRANVYRILNGEIKNPGLATRDCIERFVEKGERFIAKASQMRRSNGPTQTEDLED